MFGVEQYHRHPDPPDMSVEKFVKKYRKIYKRAQALFDKHDPCEVIDGVCYRGRRIGTDFNFCCSGCAYLTDDGCEAEALWCKVWTCPTLRDSGHCNSISHELNDLIYEADKLCKGVGGRKDLSDYIQYFYGKRALAKWQKG